MEITFVFPAYTAEDRGTTKLIAYGAECRGQIRIYFLSIEFKLELMKVLGNSLSPHSLCLKSYLWMILLTRSGKHID